MRSSRVTEERAWLFVGVLEEAGKRRVDLSIEEIAERMDCRWQAAYRAKRYASEYLCPDLGLRIAVDKHARPPLYRLTGEWINDDGRPAIRGGVSTKTKDLKSRLRDIIADAEVGADRSDGRTKEGKEAKLILLYVGPLMEQLEALKEEFIGKSA